MSKRQSPAPTPKPWTLQAAREQSTLTKRVALLEATMNAVMRVLPRLHMEMRVLGKLVRATPPRQYRKKARDPR